MKWVWTWGGKCFGYIDGENLWTHNGKHVGRIYGDEIYGANGIYLGELKSENRLITNIAKKSWKKYSFTPYAPRVGYVPYADYVGYVMYAGYEDFPPPNAF
jgi:hypothetical protein